MPNLLVVAHADRDDVGESWTAYQWTERLCSRYDVTLLTYRKRGRPSAIHQLPHARVIEWIEPRGFGRFDRLNSMLKPGWVPFYIRARRWIRTALADGERFDLAFQPTPAAMRYPSPAAGLSIPLVVGPLGGGLESPAGFADDDTAPWYVGLRRLDRFRLRHDPLLRRTYETAACVIGAAPYVRESLAGLRLQRFEVMGQGGIDGLPPPLDRSGRGEPVRLLFVGRLIRTKAARDVIRAMGLRPELPVVLDVVGDGFDREACEQLTKRLGLEGRVRFHGKIPHQEVGNFFTAADVFVFPSYREPGGIVVLEAMANGLPLIVSDRGGPASFVDDSCAFRLRVESPEQYASDIADALDRLVRNPALRHAMGFNARRRVAKIALWDNKVEQMDQLYRSILGGTAPATSV